MVPAVLHSKPSMVVVQEIHECITRPSGVFSVSVAHYFFDLAWKRS